MLGAATLAVAAATMPIRLVRGSAGGARRADPARRRHPAADPAEADTGGRIDARPGVARRRLPQVAQVSDVPQGGALPFTVPFDAPASLPAGDPAVIVQLPSGAFVAYDAVCTHEGCTVEWAGQESILFCPCHGAAFDAAADGRVLQGPARRPLASLPLVVDQASGTISLQG